MKAILVIDMPDNCCGCPCCSNKEYSECLAFMFKDKKHHFNTYEYWNNMKPSWCPLRPLPEKNTWDITKNGHVTEYAEGWNACLDEITGATEPNTKKCGECRCFIRWSNFEPIYRGAKDGWCGYGKGDVSKDDVACEGFGEKDENNH